MALLPMVAGIVVLILGITAMFIVIARRLNCSPSTWSFKLIVSAAAISPSP